MQEAFSAIRHLCRYIGTNVACGHLTRVTFQILAACLRHLDLRVRLLFEMTTDPSPCCPTETEDRFERAPFASAQVSR